MKSLIFFGLVIVALVYGLRRLRQREVEAFMDADMTDFQDFRRHAAAAKSDPLLERAEAYAAANPNVIALKAPVAGAMPEDEREVSAPDPALFQLKSPIFDEITRHVLGLLNKATPANVIIQREVLLCDFVRTEGDPSSVYRLGATRVRFLICDASMMPLCGIELKDGRPEQEFIKGVFGDIGLPLLHFPATAGLSEAEIRDQLDAVLLGRQQQTCPRCGEKMTVRKASGGKSSGKMYWVCQAFPRCNGVLRV